MTKKHLLALLAASIVIGCQSDPPLEVAPKVEISQLQGEWYEIARLPRTTEADCHGTTAFYTQAADGSLGSCTNATSAAQRARYKPSR